MPSVLLVDAHPVMRVGLKHLLVQPPISATFGEAADVPSTLAALQAHRRDLVILDIDLPGVRGLELLVTIKKAYPTVPVLMFTDHPEHIYAMRSLKAGAAGYLMKTAAGPELLAACRKILAGENYVTTSLSTTCVDRFVHGGARRFPHERLSNRETEVLSSIAAGETVGQIAQALRLNERTVSTYRTRILRKLSLRNTPELIRYALDNRLA